MSVADEFDIAVIGGGINGAGIARDAATRGLKVILLESSDFAGGTSSASSRLIHGGLRCLEYGEIPLVFESLHERRRLRRLAPHLVNQLRLTIPIYQQSRRGRWMIRLGLTAYDLLSIGKKMPRHRMLSRESMRASLPGIDTDGLVGGAEYFDAQVTFAERLVIENIIAASEAGAVIRNYSPVIGINVRQSKVRSLQYRDERRGEEFEIGARAVINAAGPWVDRVLATVNREMPRQMGGTKGSHLVVGRFDGAPDSALYVEARADGRPFFIIPWNEQILIGTTDIRYSGNPRDVIVSIDEIEYLLSETNFVFPGASLKIGDIHHMYAGVRPLPKRDKGPESAITRKHIIRRHSRVARGLLSVIGGKLTTYRNLAEQVVDKSLRYIDEQSGPCRTREEKLPGAREIEQARRNIGASGFVSPECAARLLSVYGGRAADIVLNMRGDENEPFIDNGRLVPAAEIRYSIDNEFAQSLTDIVFRRTMLGFMPDQSAPLFERIADVAASRLSWTPAAKSAELKALREYAARLRPVDPASDSQR